MKRITIEGWEDFDQVETQIDTIKEVVSAVMAKSEDTEHNITLKVDAQGVFVATQNKRMVGIFYR